MLTLWRVVVFPDTSSGWRARDAAANAVPRRHPLQLLPADVADQLVSLIQRRRRCYSPLMLITGVGSLRLRSSR